MIFKYLISLFLTSSPLVQGEGWFPVEKRNSPSDFFEKDGSDWVLFSKNLGSERFSIYFPEDPVYRYTEEGVLEIVSQDCILRVFKKGSSLPTLLTGSEKIIQTKDHIFHFKSVQNLETFQEILLSIKVIA